VKQTLDQPSKVVLAIDFQDGFEDDTVAVEFNDKEVFREKHVKTRLPLGFASTFKTSVKKGRVQIKVNVLTKKIERTITLNVQRNIYLGISIFDGIIQHIIKDTPFGYL